jgi:hypothetical protein
MIIGVLVDIADTLTLIDKGPTGKPMVGIIGIGDGRQIT